MDPLPQVIPWPPFSTLNRLLLALGVGLFIGLEREWRGKEAGLRTFGFASLMGALGGLLGPAYGMLSIGLLGVLVAFLNLQSLQEGKGTELTTSVALLLTGFIGVTCGLGHTITPTAVAVGVAGLLTWKERLAGFSHKITAEELRSAILLGVLAFAVYPILPANPVDPWHLINPRQAWVIVILIAGMGFANYLLWKIFGEHGVEFAGFLGGLVNSTVASAEFGVRARQSGAAASRVAYRGVLLATTAMALRNAVILGLVAIHALFAAVLPLVLVMLSSAVFALLPQLAQKEEGPAPTFEFKSPFSLLSAIKFALVFLVLQVLGTLGQTALGQPGFYAVSVLGGLVSSASAVASAAALASQGHIDPAVAGVGAVLASLASAAVNFILVARVSGLRSLNLRLGRAITVVVALGVAGAVLQYRVHLFR